MFNNEIVLSTSDGGRVLASQTCDGDRLVERFGSWELALEWAKAQAARLGLTVRVAHGAAVLSNGTVVPA